MILFCFNYIEKCNPYLIVLETDPSRLGGLPYLSGKGFKCDLRSTTQSTLIKAWHQSILSNPEKAI
jgi:hypothetical protein